MEVGVDSESSFLQNGLLIKEAEAETRAVDLLIKAVESSEMSKRERVMDGGLSKTENVASLEAFLLPANKNAHERGIVIMLAVAVTIPMSLLAAYHGTRFLRIWR